MGNGESKKSQAEPGQQNLEKLFADLSKRKKCIARSELQKAWGSQIDPQLYSSIEKYMFEQNPNEVNSTRFCNLCTQLLEGDFDEKAEELMKLIISRENALTYQSLLEFVIGVLSSIFIIEEVKLSKNFKSWHGRSSKNEKSIKSSKSDSLHRLGTYYLSEIGKSSDSEYSEKDLQILLRQFDVFLSIVLGHLYRTGQAHSSVELFPKWINNQLTSGKKLEQVSILDIVQLLFLNLELPVDFQNEWRLLFSTKVDGESFSRLSGQILSKGATILIIKDKQGYVFGGFAPESWSAGPQFFGDSSCFLFTLCPEMHVFSSSSFNENYQYLNIGQQTLPNGLGMGGQFNYFGLWLSAEFGSGSCSESCTTFRNYKMMSATKEFTIAHIEVWGVGAPPPTDEELGVRSVLDSNQEVKAMLELAGKSQYSEGLREHPQD